LIFVLSRTLRALEVKGARWCLGPAGLKAVVPSVESVRRPATERCSPKKILSGGNDRSRAALGPQSTAGRLRVRVVPALSPTVAWR